MPDIYSSKIKKRKFVGYFSCSLASDSPRTVFYKFPQCFFINPLEKWYVIFFLPYPSFNALVRDSYFPIFSII
jgi:hypothetical protein